MQTAPKPTTLDLEEVARRMLALSTIAVEEHIAALGRSQADALLKLARQAGTTSAASLPRICT